MASHTIIFGSGLEGPQTNVGIDIGVRNARWGGPPCTERALIDTGATSTTISPAVRKALNPMKIGRARVHLPGPGVVWNDTYFVRVKFGRPAETGRWFGLEVIVYQPSTPKVEILIGMDLLVRIHMAWDGPRGRLLLTY